jgi:tRNA G10  N-methylase Trm11
MITSKNAAQSPRHPARFSDAALETLAGLVPVGAILLDPFAGTGRIHELAGVHTVGVELEPEWAGIHSCTLVGDALALPFAANTFDAIATSPSYGNRLADHHEARDGSTRRSYRQDLGRPLHPNNSGAEQWGPRYRTMLERSWREAIRVLRPGGTFLLVISDHVRAGKVQRVTEWHLGTLQVAPTLTRAWRARQWPSL